MKRKPTAAAPKSQPARHQVRLPGFISEETIGLGDVVKRLTSYAGLKPCGGCEQRAAVLNQWMAFSRRR